MAEVGKARRSRQADTGNAQPVPKTVSLTFIGTSLGKGMWSRRLTEPAMRPEELPLDAVVLSHLHGDHWDRSPSTRWTARCRC